MPLPSSETRLAPSPSPARDDGPALECITAATDAGDQQLRIRARRLYPVSRDQVFAAWTRRAAWDSWLRLRARSRATLAPYRGGAFRLELAEGPTIHVISGAITELRAPEFLSLAWVHHGKNDQCSMIELSTRDRHGLTELTLVHGQIGSRREASWLMRLWSTALDRLGDYLAEGAEPAAARRGDCAATVVHATEPEMQRPRVRTTYARSA